MKHRLILIIASLSFLSCQAQIQLDDTEDFEKISWEELNDNAIRMIGKDWMLLTAGDPEDYNMMTASWGSSGLALAKTVGFSFYSSRQGYTQLHRKRRLLYHYLQRKCSLTMTFIPCMLERLLMYGERNNI
ncbi:MAG: hypothetical protein K9H84_04035 [Bacteroidales bacterium]|nr:hypothetical protein [Bacteroidales bacterium]